ncbi:hypothetical protein EVAR_75206_1 [Eumeta japonica]|uniref:HTH psq-type domain-containing protein n=1 Tax=Eumeta variegata TaxID=151549 RepID=A0A4C1U0M7_EUMVA|nr:hypothetical protein EVAR_75206_1 [Eumeta japonica]
MAPKKRFYASTNGLGHRSSIKGLEISEAAKKFNVPRITLHNKVTGKSPINCPMESSTILSKEEKSILEIWIKEMLDKYINVAKEVATSPVWKAYNAKKEEQKRKQIRRKAIAC